MQELRREVPRQPADWLGFYRFDSAPNDPWRCCRVIDISPLGAGLELFQTTPEECAEGHLSFSVELHGELRDTIRDETSSTARVGLEFPAPSRTAVEYIKSLNGFRSRW
jgi:hypothetical protein